MTPTGLMAPSSLRLYGEPFPHLMATSSLGPDSVLSLLDWFESMAAWKLVETDFYQQYELDLGVCGPSAPLSVVVNEDFLGKVREEASVSFARSFAGPVEWTVHKLLPGQRIRIHNDLLNGGETHRIILHLNRGWDSSQGGFLMFFDGPDPVDMFRVLMPLNESIVGFEISDRSCHAVSVVLRGERYAIVYSLYSGD